MKAIRRLNPPHNSFAFNYSRCHRQSDSQSSTIFRATESFSPCPWSDIAFVRSLMEAFLWSKCLVRCNSVYFWFGVLCIQLQICAFVLFLFENSKWLMPPSLCSCNHSSANRFDLLTLFCLCFTTTGCSGNKNDHCLSSHSLSLSLSPSTLSLPALSPTLIFPLLLSLYHSLSPLCPFFHLLISLFSQICWH